MCSFHSPITFYKANDQTSASTFQAARYAHKIKSIVLYKSSANHFFCKHHLQSGMKSSTGSLHFVSLVRWLCNGLNVSRRAACIGAFPFDLPETVSMSFILCLDAQTHHLLL